LLDSYREGLSTTEAVEKVFQMPKSDFETGYVEHLKHVVAGLNAGRADPAMSFAELERAYAADSENPDVAARLANEYVRRRNYPKARELAMQALAIQKDHPFASYVLAQLSILVGEVDRAREILEPALDRDNPEPRVLQLLAELYVRAKRYDDAEPLYEIGSKLYPAESRWQAGLAYIALQAGEREKLGSILERLSLLDADDPSPRKKLASMALEDHDWGRAVRFAWMTLHIDVADAEAHAMLGDACAGQSKWADAADEYRTVLQLKPNDRSAPLKLARAYRSAGQREDAIETAQQLLARDPENREARELLDELESNQR
jgi:tetratricopeptide (TPR) repeat protein